MQIQASREHGSAARAPLARMARGLRRMSGRLGWRLGLGFGTLLLMMMGALGLAMVQVGTMNDLTQRFGMDDMPRLMRVQTLTLYTEGAGNALLRLMNAPRDQRVAEYSEVDERNRQIDVLVAALTVEFDDPAQGETLIQLSAARTRYAEAFVAMADEVEADDLPRARQVYAEQVRPALQALLTQSKQLIDRERANIERELAEAQQRIDQLFAWLAVLGVVAVAVAAVLAWRTTRSVVVPLTSLEVAAQRIARGDYTGPEESKGSEEVARVREALSSMTAAIAQREREIERLAYLDALTGLPNRTYLLHPPSQTTVTPPNTLILFDLARLKTINETLGHVTGDTLIREVARRAEDVVRAAFPVEGSGSAAVLAHLSAGRFALAMQLSERQVADDLREQLAQAMQAPVLCSGHSVDLSLVFGLADMPAAGAEGDTLTLLRNAEIALQAAKRAALAHAWYSEAQEAARLSHLSLLSDLREALAGHQLQMWLQPKFALADGRAVGAEALVRWQHPQRGFISPAEFIPFAEQTGAIGLITHWMLEQAVRTLAAWSTSHPELVIAVNISTHDLQDDALVQHVQRLLVAHAVAPQRLRLEIVETGLMQDPERSVAMLLALRDLGVHLSIDDFGTGHSSLAYLQRLPVTELKIDRSFVDGLDHQPLNQRLVRTMVELARGMALTVTAEGVETEAERQALIVAGCDVMQGYLGSRPLHGETLQAWLRGLG